MEDPHEIILTWLITKFLIHKQSKSKQKKVYLLPLSILPSYDQTVIFRSFVMSSPQCAYEFLKAQMKWWNQKRHHGTSFCAKNKEVLKKWPFQGLPLAKSGAIWAWKSMTAYYYNLLNQESMASYRYKWLVNGRGEMRKLFIIVEKQLIKVEGVIRLENHYLTTTIITDLGKNHQEC